MNALLETNPVEVPNSLVEAEIQRLMQNARHDMEQRGGAKMKDFPMQREWFVDQGQAPRPASACCCRKSSRSIRCSRSPSRSRAIVEEAAQSYEHPEEVVRWYYAQHRSALADIEAVAIEDNVVAWALSSAKVVDKAVAFDELMGQKGLMPLPAAFSCRRGALMSLDRLQSADQWGSAGARPGADGHRAERPRRARLRHLFALAEGAGDLPDRPGQRRDGQSRRRPAAFPRGGESRQGHPLLHQFARRLGIGRHVDLRHDAVHQAGRVDLVHGAGRRLWAPSCFRPAPRASALHCPIPVS